MSKLFLNRLRNDQVLQAERYSSEVLLGVDNKSRGIISFQMKPNPQAGGEAGLEDGNSDPPLRMDLLVNISSALISQETGSILSVCGW